MDNKLLEKTRNKLKHELSSEEQEALRKCSATVNTHSRIGAILGGSLSVYGMYRRKLWPLSKYWGRGLFFGVGGIVVGMQLGLVTASIRCVQIVKALPDPQHVMKALREVQVELQDARRRPLQGEREWKQRSEDDGESSDTEAPGGISTEGRLRTAFDDSSYQAEQMREPIQRRTGPYNGPGPDPDLLPKAKVDGRKGDQSQSVWQQIRGEEQRPETAWDRLRKSGSSAEQTPAADDSPFAVPTASSQASDQPMTAEENSKEAERMREQSDFDRLLERERTVEAEDSRRKVNRFGDYE